MLVPQSETADVVVRRPLDIEDYIDIVRRHRSWILGPAFAGLVIGVVTAFLWPDRFVSSGAIRVVPPQIPQKLVPTNVSEEIAQRMNSMYQSIISRPNLTNLINTLNLYPEERKSKPTEDVIEEMRRNIRMNLLRGIARTRRDDTAVAYAISFSYEDRKKAQDVTRELISRFIDESLRARSSASVSTTEFLKDQVAAAKKDYDDVQKRVAEFRVKFPNETSESEEQTLGRIASIENMIQAMNLSMSRASQDKLQLEAQLRSLREQALSFAPPPPAAGPSGEPAPPPPAPKSERVLELEREIGRLEGGLLVLRHSYKDDHPDVQKALAFIATKKKERDQVQAADEAARPSTQVAGQPNRPAPGLTPEQVRAARDISARVGQIQAQIQAKDQEVEDLTRQSGELRKRITTLQGRLESSPAVRQQFQQFLRDELLTRQKYEAMNAKLQDSSLATDLENRRQGEQLELLEEANLPQEPYAPKRLPMVLGGMGAGFVVGLLLAGIREVKDSSLKNLKDVRAYTRLTVLGSIPLLESDFVVRRRRRLALVAWVAAFLVGVLLMTGSVYHYISTRT